MRILITNESRGVHGGIETYLRAVSLRLVAGGHELAWLFGASDSGGPGVDTGHDERSWRTADGADARAAIDGWRPDVVYANGLHDPDWDSWLARRFPTYYFAHGFFGACISGRKCNGVGALRVCQRTLGPSCLVHYLPQRCGGRSPVRMFRDYGRERHRQRNLHEFAAIIVASTYMAQEYQRQGISSDRVHVVPLFPVGIAPDPDPPARRSSWTNNVLLVSRLTDIKGADFVVEAVSIAGGILGRSLRLVVLGDGPRRAGIENDAARSHVSVDMVGWADIERRNTAMRDADALLVPSVWPEPFGLVGIEAGCVGVPSVAFAVGGTGDWLKSGESGESAAGGAPSAKALGEALARVLASPDTHHRLRIGAWQVSQQFGIDRHVDHLTRILDSGRPR